MLYASHAEGPVCVNITVLLLMKINNNMGVLLALSEMGLNSMPSGTKPLLALTLYQGLAAEAFKRYRSIICSDSESA